MKNPSKAVSWAYWIAMLIVIGSHIYMLAVGLPENQLVSHAVVNLIAAGLFGYVWTKQK